MEEAVRNQRIEINSVRFYEELKTFVWAGNKPSAMKGHHDDAIMSFAIGLWVTEKFGGQISSADVNLANEMIKGMKVNSTKQDETVISPWYGGNQKFTQQFNPFLPIMTNDSIIDTGQNNRNKAIGDFSWVIR